MDGNEQGYEFGRVWLFHPSGARLELPLPAAPLDAFNWINQCIEAGFLASAPDNVGLDRLDVAYVVRCQFTHSGNVKTRLYFYKSFGEMGSDMTVYMDSAQDITSFERASGLKVEALPIYEGDAAPQRTGTQFSKYAVPTNFTVSREKEAPSQKYKTGRWVLRGYVGFANPAPQPEQPATNSNGHSEPPNYETEALNWFASNGVAFADVRAILGIEKPLPATVDKTGWAKIMRDYAAIVKKATK